MGDLPPVDSDAPPIHSAEPLAATSSLLPSLRGLSADLDPIAAALNQPYTPYYCEENVYLLLRAVQSNGAITNAYAVFVSNPTRSVWLFQQLASTRDDSDFCVNWDYHVIPVVNDGRWWVLDRDSRLGPKVPLNEYVTETFKPWLFVDLPLSFEARSRFRVVPADRFLARFASDRSHMIAEPPTTPPSFIHPPPSYPPICSPAALAQKETHNLWTHYLCMDSSDPSIASDNSTDDFGELMELEELVACFREVSAAKS